MLMFGNYGVSKHIPLETNVYAMIIFATDRIIFTGFHVVLVRTRIIFIRYDAYDGIAVNTVSR